MFDTPTYTSAGQTVYSLSATFTGHARLIFQRVTVWSTKKASTNQNCGSCFPLGSGDLEVNVCNGSLAGKYRNNSAVCIPRLIFCQGQRSKIWEYRLSYKTQRAELSSWETSTFISKMFWCVLRLNCQEKGLLLVWINSDLSNLYLLMSKYLCRTQHLTLCKMNNNTLSKESQKNQRNPICR